MYTQLTQSPEVFYRFHFCEFCEIFKNPFLKYISGLLLLYFMSLLPFYYLLKTFSGGIKTLLIRNGLVSLFPSYENQWIDLECKSIDWFSCDGNNDTNPFRVKRRNVTNWTNLQRLRSFLRVWVARFCFTYMRYGEFYLHQKYKG